jgi:glycosyltransferase involved in cell wall biosynthesis
VLLGHVPPDVDLPALRQNADLSGRIMALGYVPREHIGPILGRADLFVLPSLYEGFGLPVLEAQASQVPMACATAGSLPEVAGDGAMFFDPMSADDIAQAMRRILSDEGLRSSLRERGERNVGRFLWDNAARDTLDVYRKVLSQL